MKWKLLCKGILNTICRAVTTRITMIILKLIKTNEPHFHEQELSQRQEKASGVAALDSESRLTLTSTTCAHQNWSQLAAFTTRRPSYVACVNKQRIQNSHGKYTKSLNSAPKGHAVRIRVSAKRQTPKNAGINHEYNPYDYHIISGKGTYNNSCTLLGIICTQQTSSKPTNRRQNTDSTTNIHLRRKSIFTQTIKYAEYAEKLHATV